MEQDRSALLPALQDMFPSMPEDILSATLDAHQNSIEAAIGALLEMCAGSVEASALTTTTGGLGTSEQHCESQALRKSRKSKARSNSAQDKNRAPSYTPAADPRPNCAGTSHDQAPPPLRATWGQLQAGNQAATTRVQHQRQQHSHQQRLPAGWVLGQPPSSCHSPKYVVPGSAAAARLGIADFPDLAPAGAVGGSTSLLGAGTAVPVGRSSSTVKPSYSAGSLQDLTERVGSLSFTGGSASSLGPGSGGVAAAAATSAPPPRAHGSSLPIGYADVARHHPQQQHQSVASEGSWARPAGAGEDLWAGAWGSGDAAAEEGWQAVALEELCRSHPWAGRDLVEAVCMALRYDLTEVVAALDELTAASYQCGEDVSGSGCGGASGSAASAASASTSAASSSEPDEDGYEDGEGAGKHPLRASRGAVAAAEPYDFAAQRGCLAGRGPGSAADGGSRRRRGGGAAEASGSSDAYSRHRRSALKLTHAWRKRMAKASAAFSAGDRALGRRLVAEAQELRQRAAAAHAEAAERIEAEMNQGRQLSEWELDLHGLHVSEAVEALAKRIAALEPGVTAAAAAAAAASPAAAARAAGAPARRKAQQPQALSAAAAAPPPTPPTSAADAAFASAVKLLASRRVLRVIVGKGLHSSGGEASLPRVVEGYLLEHGYRFTRYAGIMEVQLRRHFAVAAAAHSHTAPATTMASTRAAVPVAGGSPAHRRLR